MKPRSLNFANASLLRVPHHGLKIPQKRAVYQSRGRSLNFSFFNISGGMRWGSGEKRWVVRANMFGRIPSVFLNGACQVVFGCGKPQEWITDDGD